MNFNERHLNRRRVLQSFGAAGGLYGLDGRHSPMHSAAASSGAANDLLTVDAFELFEHLATEAGDVIKEKVHSWLLSYDAINNVDNLPELVDDVKDVLDSSVSIPKSLEALDILVDRGEELYSELDDLRNDLEEEDEEEDEDEDEDGDGSSQGGGQSTITTGAAAGVTAGAASGADAAVGSIPDPRDFDEVLSDIEELAEDVKDAVAGIGDRVKGTWEDVKEFIEYIKEGISNIVSDLVDWFVDEVFKPALEGFADPLADMLDAMDDGGSLPSMEIGGIPKLSGITGDNFGIEVDPLLAMPDEATGPMPSVGRPTGVGAGLGARSDRSRWTSGASYLNQDSGISDDVNFEACADIGDATERALCIDELTAEEAYNQITDEVEHRVGPLVFDETQCNIPYSLSRKVYYTGLEFNQSLPGLSNDIGFTVWTGVSPGSPCLYHGIETDAELKTDLTEIIDEVRNSNVRNFTAANYFLQTFERHDGEYEDLLGGGTMSIAELMSPVADIESTLDAAEENIARMDLVDEDEVDVGEMIETWGIDDDIDAIVDQCQLIRGEIDDHLQQFLGRARLLDEIQALADDQLDSVPAEIREAAERAGELLDDLEAVVDELPEYDDVGELVADLGENVDEYEDGGEIDVERFIDDSLEGTSVRDSLEAVEFEIENPAEFRDELDRIESWLSGLTEDQIAELHDDLDEVDLQVTVEVRGVELNKLRRVLESDGYQFNLYDEIRTHVDHLVNHLVQTVKDKIADKTTVSWDLEEHLPSIGCHRSMCKWQGIHFAGVAVLVDVIVTLAKSVKSSFSMPDLSIDLPGLLKEVLWFIVQLVVLMALVVLICKALIFIFFPEPGTTAVGVIALPVLIAILMRVAGGEGQLFDSLYGQSSTY